MQSAKKKKWLADVTQRLQCIRCLPECLFWKCTRHVMVMVELNIKQRIAVLNSSLIIQLVATVAYRLSLTIPSVMESVACMVSTVVNRALPVVRGTTCLQMSRLAASDSRHTSERECLRRCLRCCPRLTVGRSVGIFYLLTVDSQSVSQSVSREPWVVSPVCIAVYLCSEVKLLSSQTPHDTHTDTDTHDSLQCHSEMPQHCLVCRCRNSLPSHVTAPTPLSPSFAVILNHISSHFLIPLSNSSLICTVHCMHSDSSFRTLHTSRY